MSEFAQKYPASPFSLRVTHREGGVKYSCLGRSSRPRSVQQLRFTTRDTNTAWGGCVWYCCLGRTSLPRVQFLFNSGSEKFSQAVLTRVHEPGGLSMMPSCLHLANWPAVSSTSLRKLSVLQRYFLQQWVLLVTSLS